MSSNNDKIIIKIPAGNYEITSAQLEEMNNVAKVLEYLFNREVIYMGVDS